MKEKSTVKQAKFLNGGTIQELCFYYVIVIFYLTKDEIIAAPTINKTPAPPMIVR